MIFKKKKRIIWIGTAILLGIIVLGVAVSGNKAAEVETGQVVKGEINKYVEETAVVQMEDQVTVSAVAGGRILEVLVQAGDQVKAGDVLAKLDEKEVLLQIQALEAQMQSAVARFEEAKNPADQEETNKLKAQLRSAEASYSEAERAAENNKTLYDSGAISFDTYQSSLTKLALEKSNLETAQSNLAAAQKGASANVKKEYQGQIAEIQAQIDLLKKQSNDLTIKASIDGVILTQEMKTGSFIQPGTLLFEIGSNSGTFLESDILVDEIGDVKVGATVLIENEDLGIKDMKGTVRKIYPKAFSKTSELGIEQKRVKVEIDFNNGGEMLKPGYDLDIKIITASKKDTLIVDENAVFDYQGKDHVFVVEGGKAKLKAIEKGIESDERIEILQGLTEGEEIILSPDETVEEEMKVK
ncbi:MAG: efflux RND transporter periplasmic adaptor subunit [Dehalobacterium sp.]